MPLATVHPTEAAAAHPSPRAPVRHPKGRRGTVRASRCPLGSTVVASRGCRVCGSRRVRRVHGSRRVRPVRRVHGSRRVRPVRRVHGSRQDRQVLGSQAEVRRVRQDHRVLGSQAEVRPGHRVRRVPARGEGRPVRRDHRVRRVPAAEEGHRGHRGRRTELPESVGKVPRSRHPRPHLCR